MRRALPLLLILAVLLVACDLQGGYGTSPEDEGWVQFSVSEEKRLYSDIDPKISYFEYSAEAMFTVSGDLILRGETRNSSGDLVFASVTCYDGVTPILGPFTQGRWCFHLRACNAAGMILYEDAQEAWIAKTTTAHVHFDGKTGVDVGVIEVDITAPKTGVTNGLDVRFIFAGMEMAHKTHNSEDWNMDEGDPDSDVEVRYTGRVTVPAGSYTIIFTLPYGGDVIAAQVLAGETTHITGSIYPNAYTDGYLQIVTPEETRVHMTASAPEIQKNSSATFTLVKDAGTFTASNVKWYVNGEFVLSGSMTYTFTPTSSGIFDIVACVYKSTTDTSTGQDFDGSTVVSSITYDTSSSATANIKVIEPKYNVSITNRNQILDADWQSEKLLATSTVQKSGVPSLSITKLENGFKVTGWNSENRYITFYTMQTTGKQYRLYSEDELSNPTGSFHVIKWEEMNTIPTTPPYNSGTVVGDVTEKIWTASKGYVAITIELDGDTTITDLHLREIQPIYDSMGNQINVSNYQTSVAQLHADGRYTLQELGRYQK